MNISIELLRIISVFLVLFFHAGAFGFDRGYLGVDIFLFISGFLMMRNLHDKKISYKVLVDFYESRFLRLMPALVSVLLITIPFAWFFLLPEHLENFGQSLVASSISMSNILFHLTTDYWDLSSELKPLLHTWSLGVEFQFYLVFPIILFVASKLGKFRIMFFISLFVLSFFLVLFIDKSSEENSAQYYLLQFRFFEFFFGAFGFILFDKYQLILEKVKYVFITFALFILLFIFNGNSYNNLLFFQLLSMFTALTIVLFGPQSSINNRFSSLIFYLGSRTYGVYLFHQPIFAFIRNSSPSHINPFILLSFIPIILILADISYRIVESPVRINYKKFRFRVWLVLIASIAILVIVGLLMHFTHGFPKRFKSISLENYANQTIEYNEQIRSLRDSNQSAPILLIGDSFARDFANVLIDGCSINRDSICYVDYNVDEFEQLDNLSTYLENRNNLKLICFVYKDANYIYNDQLFKILALRGLKYFIVGPKSFGENINYITLIEEENWPNQSVEISEKTLFKDSILKRKFNSNIYISILESVSINSRKVNIIDSSGNFISIDGEHLTKSGAEWIGLKLRKNNHFSSIFEPFIETKNNK
jgi:peptidoglycan/LPS O-acetylase OafA/YrhL